MWRHVSFYICVFKEVLYTLYEEIINQEVINNRGEVGIVTDVDREGRIIVSYQTRNAKYPSYVLEEGLIHFKSQYLNQRMALEKSSKMVNTKNLRTEHALKKLNQLTGLTKIKDRIYDLVSGIKINSLRNGYGLKTPEVTRHMVFIGNPGTGKTTVARIVAEIYRSLDILDKGHLVETDRSGLVGEYQGHTAIKTKAVVAKALGGVLFIDEAYAIIKDESDTFGYEALNTLTKEIEDHRDNLVVIIAGYKNEMEQLISKNPGLRSRFNTVIDFEDYHNDELLTIFNNLIKDNDYRLSKKAKETTQKYFNSIDTLEGNARGVRNLFDDTIRLQARRLYQQNEVSKNNLITIKEIDLPFLRSVS